MRKSRIPVWVLVSFRRWGMNESQLLDNYATLTATDLARGLMRQLFQMKLK